MRIFVSISQLSMQALIFNFSRTKFLNQGEFYKHNKIKAKEFKQDLNYVSGGPPNHT